MPDASYLLAHLGDVARGRQLQQYGISRQELAAQVASRLIRRLRAGVFASNTVASDVEAAAWHGGALSCQAALRHHGIWTLELNPTVHVWMGANGRVHAHPDCICITHFFRGRTALGLADLETALLHVYQCAGDEAFFVAFESAWHGRRLTGAARARISAALPGNGRWLVDFARSDADSGLESLIRLRLHLLGIHLECQVEIPGVGTVDFVLDDSLIIEADGEENHASPKDRHKDLMRDAAASRLGYETLRFDYAQVIHDWPAVQRAIVAARDRAAARR